MSRIVRSEPRCAGVDGCRSGWVVASRDGARIERSIAAVLADFDVVGIDMPIGLPIDGARQSDLDARRYLNPRGSTIFATPPRACIAATDYANACVLARGATGRAISVQAWNIVPKMRELDEHMTPAHEHWVAEMHPECSFAVMNNDRPLVSKHTALGLDQRSELIQRMFDTTPTAPRGARLDDVLDAYAVLWSAERFARGAHRTLPADGSHRDARGLLMRIVM